MQAQSFMFIAGEPSGDTLGAELVKALKEQNQNLDFFGAGGPKLVAAGMELEFDLTEHAVVGIWEVLKNFGKFKRFFNQLLDLASQRKPDFVVLIDYPGFNLRFAKAIKNKVRQSHSNWKPKIVYYVSPQIWAWHESRVHQIARDVDLMLAIFPFEKSWYAARAKDFRVEFVGHPLIDRFASQKQTMPAGAQSSDKLLLLPGSRVRELRKHLPVIVEAAQRLRKEQNLSVAMVLPNPQLATLAREIADLKGINVVVGSLAESLAGATAAIASSGTVTMECAYFGVPTVVIYKTSWSTYALGRRFIKVKHLAMPNLLAEQEVFPEFIQSAANPENIYHAAKELLNNPQRRNVIKTQLQRVISSLGEPGASHRAAAAILSLPQ